MNPFFLATLAITTVCFGHNSDDIDIYGQYLIDRIDFSASESHRIYFTSGKVDPMYYYWAGRIDAYYDALYHHRHPHTINQNHYELEKKLESIRWLDD